MRTCILLLVTIVLHCTANAQCGLTINTYPYSENFENNQGGWSSGGNGNAWAWGTPAKTNITTAGSGTKCWVTGGLSGTGYNSCERSFVESPCFDFTNLTAPVFAFKLFWECEFQFDGATLQYSTNGGTIWNNVGAYGDTNDCNTENWFNFDNITHLGSSGGCTNVLATVKHGWCGRIGNTAGNCQGGNGSGGWVTAKHCIANLAGQSSVRFRIVFGAGSNCNNYDGVAFDSVAIYNAAPVSAVPIALCVGVNEFMFSDSTSSLCNKTFSWNFGDPGSGTANTSTLSQAFHTYAPGTYTVTATINAGCSGSSIYTLAVSTAQVSATGISEVCPGAANGSIASVSLGLTSPAFTLSPGSVPSSTGTYNGLASGIYTVQAIDASGCVATTAITIGAGPAITVTIDAASSSNICNTGTGIIIANSIPTGIYTYTLLPSGVTSGTGTFTGLNAGNYAVLSSNTLGCTDTAMYEITGGANLAITTLLRTSPSCVYLGNGSLTVNTIGGISPLTFNIQPINNTNGTGIFTNLAEGTYSITVADVYGCTFTSVVQILGPQPMMVTNAVVSNATCAVNNAGGITIVASGGTGALQAFLQPGNLPSTNFSWSGLGTGSYTISLQDANGCLYDTFINIQQISADLMIDVTTTASSCSANTGTASLKISGGSPPYAVQWFTNPTSIADTARNLKAGIYYVQVTDGLLCVTTDTFTIPQNMCCTDLRLASAFTPNDDALNDRFGLNPSVPLNVVKMEVYSRWGEIVFETASNNVSWDGYYNGSLCPQDTYYLLLRYTCLLDGKVYVHKQDFTLLR